MHDDPNVNERRADRGEVMLRGWPARADGDVRADVTDALTDVCHTLRRMGLDPCAVFHAALDAAEGDLEDGPEAKRDTARYPDEKGG